MRRALVEAAGICHGRCRNTAVLVVHPQPMHITNMSRLCGCPRGTASLWAHSCAPPLPVTPSPL
jgi:hypothetical protein